MYIEKEGKHLFFITVDNEDGWYVVNKYDDIQLGSIEWTDIWDKYAFFPKPDTMYEEDCLRDISDFIEEKTKNKI